MKPELPVFTLTRVEPLLALAMSPEVTFMPPIDRHPASFKSLQHFAQLTSDLLFFKLASDVFGMK